MRQVRWIDIAWRGPCIVKQKVVPKSRGQHRAKADAGPSSGSEPKRNFDRSNIFLVSVRRVTLEGGGR